MAHTFLFREGAWRARGEYRDGAGVATPVDGQTRVRHEPGRWVSESLLVVRRNPPQEIRTRTEVQPVSAGAQSTHWNSEGSTLGALAGRFVFAGDAILSFYASATSRYRGFECLQQKDAKHYAVRGAMLEHDKVLSTWTFDLEAE